MMPNYVSNIVFFTGDKINVTKAMDYLINHNHTLEKDNLIDFNILLPNKKNRENNQLSQWGTKWNAINGLVKDNVILFDTAWDAPFPIFLELAQKNPDVKIDAFSTDLCDPPNKTSHIQYDDGIEVFHLQHSEESDQDFWVNLSVSIGDRDPSFFLTEEKRKAYFSLLHEKHIFTD